MFRNTLQEFKQFAVRGNAVEMAVGISVGVAFGRVVNSLVNDILMPPIGHLIGEVDFSKLYINLSSARYASLADGIVNAKTERTDSVGEKGQQSGCFH